MRISDWSSDVCSSDLTEVPSRQPTATRCECLDRPQWCRQIARSASDREGLDDAIEDGRHRLHEEAEPEPSGGRLLQSVRAVFGGPEGRATSGPRSFPLLSSEEHTSELQSLMRISYAVYHLNLHVLTHSFPTRRSSEPPTHCHTM